MSRLSAHSDLSASSASAGGFAATQQEEFLQLIARDQHPAFDVSQHGRAGIAQRHIARNDLRVFPSELANHFVVGAVARARNVDEGLSRLDVVAQAIGEPRAKQRCLAGTGLAAEIAEAEAERPHHQG